MLRELESIEQEHQKLNEKRVELEQIIEIEKDFNAQLEKGIQKNKKLLDESIKQQKSAEEQAKELKLVL